MNNIYIINYWTNQHFEKNVWDKYYCKSLTSVKRKIKELLKNDDYGDQLILSVLLPLEKYIFNTKTCFSPWIIPNLELDNIYIWITKETLF